MSWVLALTRLVWNDANRLTRFVHVTLDKFSTLHSFTVSFVTFLGLAGSRLCI